MTKFGPKLAFLVNLGKAMQAYSVPCWWVGWWLWRVGCISQDTYLLYGNDYHLQKIRLSSSNLRHMHEQVGGQGAEARGRRRDVISKTQTGCNLLQEL